jgi:hypothetical protein
MSPKISSQQPHDPNFDALFEAASGGDAKARFELGSHYYRQDDFGRARRWFSRAGKQGHGSALVELGLIELQGLGLAASAHDAREHFLQAAAAGEPQGHHELAILLYRGRELAQDRKQSAVHLNLAARGGCAAALRTCAFLAASQDQQALATRCFLLAAERGDMVSQSALAQRLKAGTGTAPNSERARQWAAHALAGGSYCQRHYHQTFDGQEGLADELLLAERGGDIELPEIRFPVARELDGRTAVAGKSIRIFDDIYSKEECEYLIELTAPSLMRSQIVHPETGRPVPNPHRTSDGWNFHPSQEDIVLLQIKERLAKQTGVDVNHAEAFAMLRYQPGQEYKAHFDFIDPSSGDAGQDVRHNGQRKTTIFSYLQSVGAGGETEFPRLDVQVSPRQGRAVMFDNISDNGEPDLESLHASLPVIKGEKWLAVLWIRDRPLYNQ